MPVLTPPVEHRRSLLVLAQMGEDSYGSLRTALSVVGPPDEETADDGDKGEAGEAQIDEETKPVLRVIETIFVMHSVRAQHELDIPEFVDSVMSGVEDSHNPVFSSSEIKTASNRLRELLSLDGMVSRRSKSRSVVRDHGMTFCGFRVLTDIRPVFSNDAEKDPDEMVIVHTIKLAYHEAGKHKEVFVSADSKDLKKLRDALDRAEKKAATLSRLLTERNIGVSGAGG